MKVAGMGGKYFLASRKLGSDSSSRPSILVKASAPMVSTRMLYWIFRIRNQSVSPINQIGIRRSVQLLMGISSSLHLLNRPFSYLVRSVICCCSAYILYLAIPWS